uniref:Uncharacterized protein n=1 Tax=Ditylenchus dipsaci TaxID=166011 RepID=A0A915DP44_9BILA
MEQWSISNHRGTHRVPSGRLFWSGSYATSSIPTGRDAHHGDDCEFVLVEHSDYCSIMSTLNQHIEREVDQATGEVVREVERRVSATK